MIYYLIMDVPEEILSAIMRINRCSRYYSIIEVISDEVTQDLLTDCTFYALTAVLDNDSESGWIYIDEVGSACNTEEEYNACTDDFVDIFHWLTEKVIECGAMPIMSTLRPMPGKFNDKTNQFVIGFNIRDTLYEDE